MADYELREYRDEDLPSLLDCFNTVFREGNPDHVDRTRAEWEYLFARNPAGRRIFVAAHGDQVVAQYAALPIHVWMAGKERTFAQIVDSMVHPDHRRGLKRPGLFVQTALPFFETFGGKDKDWVHYGWPVEPAWRIGKKFLKYEVVRTQTVLAREPDRATEMPPEVERMRSFDHQARWVYERCVDDFGASAIRNDRFLNWRFVENPFHDYVIFGVRDAETLLRGYAVYRFCDWKLPRMGVIVDWLVPPGEPEVEAAHAREQRTEPHAAPEGTGWLPCAELCRTPRSETRWLCARRRGAHAVDTENRRPHLSARFRGPPRQAGNANDGFLVFIEAEPI